MKSFTLTFSHIVDGIRVPLMDAVDPTKEATITVEADSKTATYSLEVVVNFCETHGNDCRVRRVL